MFLFARMQFVYLIKTEHKLKNSLGNLNCNVSLPSLFFFHFYFFICKLEIKKDFEWVQNKQIGPETVLLRYSLKIKGKEHR